VDIVGFQEVQLSPNEQSYPRYNKFAVIFSNILITIFTKHHFR